MVIDKFLLSQGREFLKTEKETVNRIKSSNKNMRYQLFQRSKITIQTRRERVEIVGVVDDFYQVGIVLQYLKTVITT